MLKDNVKWKFSLKIQIKGKYKLKSRHYFTYNRKIITKKTMTSIGEGTEKWGYSYISGSNIKCYNLFENTFAIPQNDRHRVII